MKDSVPTPYTRIVPLPKGWYNWLDHGLPKEFVDKVRREISIYQFSYPIFLRTDQMACKHSWKRTCFVEHGQDLGQHIYNLLEENELCNNFGEVTPAAVVIREFLELNKFFRCTSYGNMPVAKEFRFFATKGKVDCWHPYWVHGALEEGSPDNPQWKDLIPQLEELSKNDFECCGMLAQNASANFEEQVSLDICQTNKLRWLVTDMACGGQSFHWKHNTTDGGGRD